jgi:hypothetical protein
VSELLREYDSAKAERRALIETVVAENQNGLTRANSYLRTIRKEEPFFCHPDKLVLTGPQIIDMLRREIDEDPKAGIYPYGFAILMANAKVFSCSPQKNSN